MLMFRRKYDYIFTLKVVIKKWLKGVYFGVFFAFKANACLKIKLEGGRSNV